MASVPERNLSSYICRGAQTSWSNALAINHKNARLCLWPFMWVQLHSFFKASVIITDDPKTKVKIKLSSLTWERVVLYCGLITQVALQIFSTQQDLFSPLKAFCNRSGFSISHSLVRETPLWAILERKKTCTLCLS